MMLTASSDCHISSCEPAWGVQQAEYIHPADHGVVPARLRSTVSGYLCDVTSWHFRELQQCYTKAQESDGQRH